MVVLPRYKWSKSPIMSISQHSKRNSDSSERTQVWTVAIPEQLVSYFSNEWSIGKVGWGGAMCHYSGMQSAANVKENEMRNTLKS